MQTLAGVKLAVLGGDSREKVYVPILRKLGAEVFVYGNDKLRELDDINYCESLEDIKIANVIILPITGITTKGEIYAPCFPYKIYFSTIAANLQEGTTVFLGKASPQVRELAAKYHFGFVEFAEDDELAILNAVPTAEGALRLAIELTPHTIHGCNTVIIGYGRVGKVVARLFKSVNSKVNVVARDSRQLALAEAFGFDTTEFYNKASICKFADIIINTVPAMVIDKNDLTALSPTCVIIDLASSPGGIDYEAAKQLNTIAVLAPGLPGKVAPQSAGEIISRVLPKLIIKKLQLTQGGQEG